MTKKQGESSNTSSAIKALWEDVRELSLGTSSFSIDRLPSPPSPISFLRNYVLPNKPCIISNATHHWPALTSWTHLHYLSQTLSDRHVSLHLTPDGRADALAPHSHSHSHSHPQPHPSLCFASAHVQRVPFPSALQKIQDSASPSSSYVAYAQEQNDCFRSEYEPLASDVEPHVPWASEALGSLPEAVNLWIGNRRSETSFHKDHYENLYAVVTGEKVFTLLPPTDLHRLYVRDYPAASYAFSQETGEFKLELEKPLRYVPWCSVNPYPSASTKEREMSSFPRYFDGPEPFQCTVKAGEILYLPSMWFHHVRQIPDNNGLTIAVNYWYEMQFDIKYAYYNFLKSIDYPSDDECSAKVCKCHRESVVLRNDRYFSHDCLGGLNGSATPE